jgi:hypothetical protein
MESMSHEAESHKNTVETSVEDSRQRYILFVAENLYQGQIVPNASEEDVEKAQRLIVGLPMKD